MITNLKVFADINQGYSTKQRIINNATEINNQIKHIQIGIPHHSHILHYFIPKKRENNS